MPKYIGKMGAVQKNWHVFLRTITEIYLKKSKDGKNENRIKRADAFARAIFGEDKSHKDIQDLHYQLLSATIGTLVEAQRKSVTNAMLLVLVFKKDGCYSEEKVKDNFEDYQRYIDMLEKQKCDTFYKLAKFHDIRFYVEYLEIEV